MNGYYDYPLVKEIIADRLCQAHEARLAALARRSARTAEAGQDEPRRSLIKVRWLGGAR
jgi:hypothetical protein